MKRFNQLYGVALTKRKTHEIVFALMALEAVFAFSYLGYIEFPLVSTTTLHILVIVAAMIFGIEGSVPVVCVFALTSMWIGSFSTAALDRLFSPFASGKPVISCMLAVARMLFAVASGFVFGLYFRKQRKHIYFGIALLAILSTFLHGFIILAICYIFVPMVYRELAPNLFSLPMFQDWLSYALSAIACCGVHYFLSRQKIRDYLSCLCLCEDTPSTQKGGYQRIFHYAKIAAGVIGILCIMYLRKKILGELQLQGIELPRSSYINMTNFLVQLLCAFGCLFEIVGIIIRWITEFHITRQIKMNEKITEQSVKISIDALTGVFSRFAYNDVIESYADHIPDNLVVFVMDINGLKAVNDTLGHEAGDELICGAAQCITKVVGRMGKTFRVGGDEFIVVGTMKKAQAEETLTELKRIIQSWSGVKARKLSLSAGYALSDDFAGYSIEDLAKEADKAMYEEKKEFYRKNGRDKK